MRLLVAGEGGVRRIFHLMPTVGWRGTTIGYTDKDEVDIIGEPTGKVHHATASGLYGHVSLVVWFGAPAD